MTRHRASALLFVSMVTLCASAQGDPPTGTVPLRLTYDVTPDPSWSPGSSVLLYADARRNPAIGQEDIFAVQRFPGTYFRMADQHFDFYVQNVRVGEKIIVQGYMCSADTSDCYPSDSDNPPSCSVEVHVLGAFQPSCRPRFTWSGGSAEGRVLCQAECMK